MEEKSQPQIKILVACHKADPAIRRGDIYMPIQVGKALHPDLELGFQTDDTGDNISGKNASYCELTALYWAWKNLKDVDYIGLCHYRRYFDMVMDEDAILSTMRVYDCIMLKPKRLTHNIVTELALLTSWENAYIFIDEILSALPEHKNEIYDYFYLSNKFSVCNMFIMSRSDFDTYCRFMFGILSKVESKSRKSGYSRQNRLLGYLSEPLLGFWLKMQKFRIKEVDICHTDMLDKKISLKSRIVNSIRVDGSFLLSTKSFKKPKPLFFEEWVLTGLKQDGITLDNI